MALSEENGFMSIEYISLPKPLLDKVKETAAREEITPEELVAALGSSERTEEQANGRLLYFEADLSAAGLIRARIDSSGRVTMLQCCEDCSPSWGTR